MNAEINKTRLLMNAERPFYPMQIASFNIRILLEYSLNVALQNRSLRNKMDVSTEQEADVIGLDRFEEGSSLNIEHKTGKRSYPTRARAPVRINQMTKDSPRT